MISRECVVAMYGSPGSYTIATAAAGTAARTSSSARGQRRECTFDWTHTPAGAVLSAGRTQGMAAKQDRGRGVGRNASRRRVKAAGRYRVTGAQCIPKGGPNGRGPAAASTNIAVPHGRCQPLRRVAARDDECMSADWQPQAPGRPSAHHGCGPTGPYRPPPHPPLGRLSPEVPRQQAEACDHEVDLVPAQVLPAVAHDAPRVAAVLVVGPPRPAVDGHLVVGPRRPLGWGGGADGMPMGRVSRQGRQGGPEALFASPIAGDVARTRWLTTAKARASQRVLQARPHLFPTTSRTSAFTNCAKSRSHCLSTSVDSAEPVSPMTIGNRRHVRPSGHTPLACR